MILASPLLAHDTAHRTWSVPEYIFDPTNPFFLALIIFSLVAVVTYVYIYHVHLPQRRRHANDRRKLLLKNARLSALFTELNPDPTLRVDRRGMVVDANKAARIIFAFEIEEKKKIREILPFPEADVLRLIDEGESEEKTVSLLGDYYAVKIVGAKELGMAHLYCHNITKRKLLEDELLANQKQVRELNHHLRKAIDRERSRVAKALHDGLVQRLLLINLDAQSANQRGEISDAATEKILESVEAAVAEVRESIYQLEPRGLVDRGLESALKGLCESFAAETGVRGEFVIEEVDGRFALDTQTQIYRIVQEALGNIRKHARAKSFFVQAVARDGELRLVISDDGVGFDREKESGKQDGFGLRNIEDRALSIGGERSIESHPGEGTTVAVRIPLGR
ncbi:MAG: hypothetical protein GF419_04355 [Ignavibacteriales bacterium]|nr:hypothetical protein [Ignavibacteriales bacterium]